ncbi:MAG TPA: FAD-dependent oxidoreductase [Pyrinomonadaceae bacterium]|nr:FAD-dependent oxidoreductase [Pyrinomonadaceae bacterium]
MSRTDLSFDVAIIGGGPAGMSAVLWCADLGLRCVLIEKSAELGGQLLWIHNPIENYPGISTHNGAEIRDKFASSLKDAAFERMLGAEVESIDTEQKRIELKDGPSIRAKAIIIATGVRRRKLNIPGEIEFTGRGILESGSKDRELVQGKSVIIVGGGDAAMENAMILSEYASSVTVVHRRAQFSARAGFLGKARSLSNIEFLMEATVTKIAGSDRLEKVAVRNTETGELRTIETDFLLIRIGVEPNSEFVEEVVALDGRGYIKIDNNCMTNREGVYAVGDVAYPLSPTVSTAVGTGAIAVKATNHWIYQAKSL